MRNRKQKLFLYGFFYLAFFSIFIFLSVGLSKLNENTLPESIKFQVNNPQFETKITTKINSIVENSKKKNISKSEMFSEISKFLDQFDVINTYSLRLGFDKTLILNADIQKPILAVHTQSGDVFIVGSAMRIIAQNPATSLVESIPNIFLPEITIKNKKNTALNFSSFLEQVNLINENFQWYDYKVEKIIWTKSVGFIVKFEGKDENSNKQSNNNFTVYLGNNNLQEKTERFKTLAIVLKQKNLNPTRIDLDLSDRIFIK